MAIHLSRKNTNSKSLERRKHMQLSFHKWLVYSQLKHVTDVRLKCIWSMKLHLGTGASRSEGLRINLNHLGILDARQNLDPRAFSFFAWERRENKTLFGCQLEFLVSKQKLLGYGSVSGQLDCPELVLVKQKSARCGRNWNRTCTWAQQYNALTTASRRRPAQTSLEKEPFP